MGSEYTAELLQFSSGGGGEARLDADAARRYDSRTGRRSVTGAARLLHPSPPLPFAPLTHIRRDRDALHPQCDARTLQAPSTHSARDTWLRLRGVAAAAARPRDDNDCHPGRPRRPHSPCRPRRARCRTGHTRAGDRSGVVQASPYHWPPCLCVADDTAEGERDPGGERARDRRRGEGGRRGVRRLRQLRAVRRGSSRAVPLPTKRREKRKARAKPARAASGDGYASGGESPPTRPRRSSGAASVNSSRTAASSRRSSGDASGGETMITDIADLASLIDVEEFSELARA